MKLAIMQPCYLPWRGYFALMNLTDVFVHLDDVPMPQGRTYQTRIGFKTANGKKWLTVPVRREGTQMIRDVEIVDGPWRSKHVRTLRQELGDAADIVADLLGRPWTHCADLNIALAMRMAEAFGLRRSATTFRSSDCHVQEKGWRKILNICKVTGATQYITGHGARHYLNHEAFEDEGIDVCYLEYDVTPYPQPHGAFDPFVTGLDVLAHAPDPASCIGATLVPWRDFVARPGNVPEPVKDEVAQS